MRYAVPCSVFFYSSGFFFQQPLLLSAASSSSNSLVFLQRPLLLPSWMHVGRTFDGSESGPPGLRRHHRCSTFRPLQSSVSCTLSGAGTKEYPTGIRLRRPRWTPKMASVQGSLRCRSAWHGRPGWCTVSAYTHVHCTSYLHTCSHARWALRDPALYVSSTQKALARTVLRSPVQIPSNLCSTLTTTIAHCLAGSPTWVHVPTRLNSPPGRCRQCRSSPRHKHPYSASTQASEEGAVKVRSRSRHGRPR